MMEKPASPARPAEFAFADLQQSKSERLADKVYENLFHAIVTGMIAAGTRLPSENTLAQEFDVSRPVLREALDKLREEGLIYSVRGSGTYVKDAVAGETQEQLGSDAEREVLERIGQMLDGIELRLIVEPEAAYLAARRRTPADIERMRGALDRFNEALQKGAILHYHDYAFHEAVATATCNPRIVDTLKSLEYDVSRSVTLMRFLVRFQPLVRVEAVQAEHEEILRHIEAGAATEAKRAMRNHIEHARIRMLNSRPAR
ncbi:FadR/GntR family transcriptional regulator [Polymorphum gilvum]|uniref:GntR family transcription regulator protein n=1 Tax=Polymorphum gilvum (strain LMG 25793 / CGMCC 1.9160 / SL003B-26A1) TaxID=991905 RepID=F2IZJ8_POLGS|nr:FadR/GntR family transcriptional regulator [Polymorphum gilvum]ADZ69555.1 GntR family transcription regulator protein [Polymorphum gilvum SL003B-26A1]